MSEPMPYTNEELPLRAALATKDGDTRDAASFLALSVNRDLIDTAAEGLRKAVQSLPSDIAGPLVAYADEMQKSKH